MSSAATRLLTQRKQPECAVAAVAVAAVAAVVVVVVVVAVAAAMKRLQCLRAAARDGSEAQAKTLDARAESQAAAVHSDREGEEIQHQSMQIVRQT